jgi:prepilin-type N-terminal cleavage/methylation domain-containing protein
MTQAPAERRGFSLVEMLLAIFILGIGVISIASLFPAGIALQRQATDDVVGPIVAKNALATIRSKLSQSDFGSFQDFALQPSYNGAIAGTFQTRGGLIIPQVAGDWCWMRPGFLLDPANLGTIDVFSSAYTRDQLGIGGSVPGVKATEIADGVSAGAGAPALYGMPYNPKRYPLYLRSDASTLDPLTQRLLEPAVTFTQSERR